MYGLTEIIAMNENRTRHDRTDYKQITFTEEDFAHIPAKAFDEKLIEHYSLLGIELSQGIYVSSPIPNAPLNEHVANLGKELHLKAGLDTYHPAPYVHDIPWKSAKKLVEQGFNGHLLSAALFWPVLEWTEKNNKSLSRSLQKKPEWLDNKVENGIFYAHSKTEHEQSYGKAYGLEHINLDLREYPGLSEARTLLVIQTEILSGQPSKSYPVGLLSHGKRLYNAPSQHSLQVLGKKGTNQGVELKFQTLQEQPPSGITVRITTDNLEKLNLKGQCSILQ